MFKASEIVESTDVEKISIQLDLTELIKNEVLAVCVESDRILLQERLNQHLPSLIPILRNLYGSRIDFESWLISLAHHMALWHNQRPRALRVLDIDRLANPSWFQTQEMIAYSAYVDRFAGTLKGVVERIPHLKELGVRYLHLLPFLRARTGENDGGFAVESYDEVEPALGDMSDLLEMSRQLRESGISLCSDFVLNHVADSHQWAKSARNGITIYREYFHILSSKADAEVYEKTLEEVFPQTAPKNFTYVEELDAWVWTTFYPYQWDLNYANPAVFFKMTEALIGLANRGVEVFRLDSTAYLWKRPGTNCMNQPEAHMLLQALRAIVDIVAPGVLLKAEAIVPSSELTSYFGLPKESGHECHMAYQSSVMAAMWASLAEQNSELLRKVLSETPTLPKHTSWLTYVRCHDDIGWKVLRGEIGNRDSKRLEWISRFYTGEIDGSYACGKSFQSNGVDQVHGTNGMTAALTGLSTAAEGAEREEAERRFLLLYGVIFTVGGIPLIYMGDEFALGNEPKPFDPLRLGVDGRQLHRPKLHAQDLSDAYSGNTPTGKFYSRFKALVNCRISLPDLAASTPFKLVDYPLSSLLAFVRGDSLHCIFNFSSEPINVTLDRNRNFSNIDVRDVLTGDKFKGQVQLLGYGMRWLVPVKSSS